MCYLSSYLSKFKYQSEIFNSYKNFQKSFQNLTKLTISYLRSGLYGLSLQYFIQNQSIMFIRKVDIPRIQSPPLSEHHSIQDVMSDIQNNLQQQIPVINTNIPSYNKPKFNNTQISSHSFLNKIKSIENGVNKQKNQQNKQQKQTQNNLIQIDPKYQFEAINKGLEKTFISQQGKDMKPFQNQQKFAKFFNLDEEAPQISKKPQLTPAPRITKKKPQSSYHYWVEQFYIPLQLQRLSYFQEISQLMRATGLILWRLTYFNEKYETKIYPDRFKMYLCYHQVVSQSRVKDLFKNLIQKLNQRLKSFNLKSPEISPSIFSSRFKKVLKKFSILKLTRQSEEQKILKKRIIMRVGPVIKKIEDQLITYCQKRVLSDKVAFYYPINVKTHETKSDYIDPLEKIIQATGTNSKKVVFVTNVKKPLPQTDQRKQTLMKLGYKPTNDNQRQNMRQKIFGKSGPSPPTTLPPPSTTRSTQKKRNTSNQYKNSHIQTVQNHNSSIGYENNMAQYLQVNKYPGSMQKSNENAAEKNILEQYRGIINHLALFNVQYQRHEETRKFENRQKQMRMEQQRNRHFTNMGQSNYATTYEILQQKLNDAIRKNDYEEINKLLELMQRLKKMPNQSN